MALHISLLTDSRGIIYGFHYRIQSVDIKAQFGKRLAELRTQRGWSQYELASRAGLDHSYIGRIESGERNITLQTIQKIATALGIEVSELFRFEDD